MLVGILGLGSIGNRHARNLMELGHQVMYHDPNALGSVDRDWLIKKADAMLICTPTKRHAPDLMDVLDARKHVLVEKPIGYDCPPFIAGMIMGTRSARPDLVVATGFNLRFHDCVRKAKELLDSGVIGKIDDARFQVRQYNAKPEYLRDGVIRNWMSHEIDIARYLLGNMEVATAYGNDTLAEIKMNSIEHDSVVVEVFGDYIRDPEVREFFISGTEGLICVNLVARRVEWGPIDDFSGNDDQKYIATDSFDENYKAEIKAFLDAVDGGDPGPLADGADGVAALQIVCDAIEKVQSK